MLVHNVRAVILFVFLSTLYACSSSSLKPEYSYDENMFDFNSDSFRQSGGRSVERIKRDIIEIHKNADSGDVDSKLALGIMYLKGGFLKKNELKGVKLLTKAARSGKIDAQVLLGKHYSGKKDYVNALKWLNKSVNKGSCHANRVLAAMHFKGRGVDKSSLKAITLLRKAIICGNSDSMLDMGVVYQQGIGVIKNNFKAYKYFTDSALAGNYRALKARRKLVQKINMVPALYRVEEDMLSLDKTLNVMDNTVKIACNVKGDPDLSPDWINMCNDEAYLVLLELEGEGKLGNIEIPRKIYGGDEGFVYKALKQGTEVSLSSKAFPMNKRAKNGYLMKHEKQAFEETLKRSQ